ncbi:uncharacterized protein LOC144946503 [Lampetra fluviatilis]
MATLMQIYQCSKCLEQFHDVDLALTHDCPLLEAETSVPDPPSSPPVASSPSQNDSKDTDFNDLTLQCKTHSPAHKWGEETTQLLISLYKERQHQFTCGKHKKKNLWNEISSGLQAKGHMFTQWQCEHRWKMLLKVYSKVVDQHKFGNSRTECTFFNELDEMYGPDAEIHPVATRSSLIMNRPLMVQVVLSEQGDHQLSEEVPSSQPEVLEWPVASATAVEEEEVQARARKRRRVMWNSGVPQWVKDLKKESFDLELQKIEDARQMHEEEMGVLSELLGILKSRVKGKLSDDLVASATL